MAARKFDIVVLGSLNTDYVVRSERLPTPGQSVRGGPLHAGFGGKGANQAVAAARLGACDPRGRSARSRDLAEPFLPLRPISVALIGRVGPDQQGREMLRALHQAKVDVRHVSVDPKTPTGAAIIAVDATGEKQISAALGANETLRESHVRAAKDIIASARVLLMQFEVPLPCVLAAARIAARHGVKVILDPAPPIKIPEELYPLLYAIRPNSDEASQITGVKVKDLASARAAGRIFLRKGVQIAALECGSAGDLVMSASEEVIVPRLKVKTVDATGAGDAFAAGLSVGIAAGLTLQGAARLANVTAGLSTTRLGAQDSMPSRREVEQWFGRSKEQRVKIRNFRV
jgi:ribokinase